MFKGRRYVVEPKGTHEKSPCTNLILRYSSFLQNLNARNYVYLHLMESV